MIRRLAFVLAGVVIATSAHAQLSIEEIEALRSQGEQEGWTFDVGQNPATEYSLDQLCGLKEPPDWQKDARFVEITPSKDLPAAFDWRVEAGGLPSVKNQGGCGSCWAFATVGPLECNIFIQDGIEVNLSEQYLVSCNSSGWGCDGGWWAHDYHEWRTDGCGDSGAVMESQFPYMAYDAPCNCPYEPREYWIQDWAYIGASSGVPPTSTIKQAIMDYGPVSVAVYANSAMQAYNGGIFNGCAYGQVNHGVVLVGWDDNDGTGVWIMRNSWGSGWGEGGYMRMPYGCSQIGYGACYVDYRGGASFETDIDGGWAPVDVQFTVNSGVEILDYSWDFGDGGTSTEQNPLYTYNDPGYYDVTLSVILESFNTVERTRYGCISVLADTLFADSIAYDPDSSLVVYIYTTNYVPLKDLYIPIEFNGDLSINPNAVTWSTEGLRSEHLSYQMQTHFNPMYNQMTFRLGNSNGGTGLPAGSGPVLKLNLALSDPAAVGQESVVDLSGYDGSHQPRFVSDKLDYTPVVRDGLISYEGCCIGIRGNVDGDEQQTIDIADLLYLVSYMFNDGPEPPCMKEANVDGDIFEQVTIDDLVYLVDYMFGSGPPPPVCF